MLPLGKSSGKIISIDADTLGRHMHIVGKSGTGRSTMLENIALSLIEQGWGLAFLDPHGESVLKIADRIPIERTPDTILWEPFRQTIKYNPLKVKDNSPKEKALAVERVLSAVSYAFKLSDRHS